MRNTPSSQIFPLPLPFQGFALGSVMRAEHEVSLRVRHGWHSSPEEEDPLYDRISSVVSFMHDNGTAVPVLVLGDGFDAFAIVGAWQLGGHRRDQVRTTMPNGAVVIAGGMPKGLDLICPDPRSLRRRRDGGWRTDLNTNIAPARVEVSAGPDRAMQAAWGEEGLVIVAYGKEERDRLVAFGGAVQSGRPMRIVRGALGLCVILADTGPSDPAALLEIEDAVLAGDRPGYDRIPLTGDRVLEMEGRD